MDPYGAQIIAESRRADFTREAATDRRVGVVRRRIRNPQTEPRPAPRQQEVARPAIV